MASSNFSDVASQARFWGTHQPDHATLLGLMGGAATHNQDACKASILGTGTHSPIVMALSLDSDPAHVYMCHSPTIVAPDPMQATPYDNKVLALIGNNLQTAIPVVLPDNAFARCANTRTIRIPAMLQDPGGFTATPPVVRFGPHASTVADTDELRARRFFIMPSDQVDLALTSKPDGRYTNQSFHHLFLAPGLASGDPAITAALEPEVEWFRLHCTNGTGGGVLECELVTGGSPVQEQILLRTVTALRTSLLSKLGAMGPGVTTPAFNAGINELKTQLATNATNHIQYLRDAGNKTFTDRHGADLAARLHSYCSVARDEDLPDIHKLMAKSPKSRDYGLLQFAIDQAVAASPLPLSEERAPIATPKLLDDVFRAYRPGSADMTALWCPLFPRRTA